MLREKIKNLKNRIIKCNAGSTLAEMIVCFALLGIFMACSATIIAVISNLYYDIQGETFARQVSDIIMGKIESEIDGALYFGEESSGGNPSIENNTSIALFDKTYTYITLGCTGNKLNVKYSAITYSEGGITDSNRSLDETTWQFDDSVYKGYMIEELYFYKKGDVIDQTTVSNFDLSSDNMDAYGDNVVLVLLHLKNKRYGDYYNKRFVKMYNVPETLPSAVNP